ncbi:MAG: ABC transporter ATP-binding protein [Eubacteriales bacterium]|nr:ABC transporter ATP-binding protein [Eubacteriales bacterium]MDD4474717.1 ABC transporter ATP-binding protein [Eubacteriales bacterium]
MEHGLLIYRNGETGMALLDCLNLYKNYGNVLALNNFNLSLESGKIVGLLGPNGSGKTTLIKLIAGLLAPTEGAIFIDGKMPGPETKAIVSYLPERTYFSDWMRVNDLIEFFSDFYADFDREKAIEMLTRLQITPERKLKELSKGTKEKVQLVLVMARRAKLYLLDEPIAGVDPASRDYILDTIISNYKENSTVLISTHLIYDVEQTLDDFVFIKNGSMLLTGNAKEYREQNGQTVDALFREMFRV